MQGPFADKVGDITGAAQGIGAADSARALITIARPSSQFTGEVHVAAYA
jgi:hypothetical protein